jgi:DNA repair protein RecO (recombination protein O)
MQWADEGVILSVKPHGETAAVAEIFTRTHGRHLGLVHGGRSRRLRPVLQTGNHVDAQWKARLAEHLGHVSVELRKGYAAQAMDDPLTLAALSSLCSLARLLAERDPHPSLFEVTLFVLSYLDEAEVWPALMVRWELALLDELGFGLDLSACAATGVKSNLIYVSPKSGRAVSAEAGEAYKDRLLPLPGFLAKGGGEGGNGTTPDDADVVAGLNLAAHFLETRVLLPREEALPQARLRFKELIERRALARVG